MIFSAHYFRKRNTIFIIRFYKITAEILNGLCQCRLCAPLHHNSYMQCNGICRNYVRAVIEYVRAVIDTSTIIRAFILFLEIVRYQVLPWDDHSQLPLPMITYE